MKKRLTIGILAHVDAGKTTLCEAMLYTAGALKKLGRVDHRDSFLDNYDQERARGITIFSKQALLRFADMDITLLDTPGHADFSSEMERTLQVLDCAILVISGTDGAQSHTDTLWKLLERYDIPTFIFVTKMDVSVMTEEKLISDLREHLGDGCMRICPENFEEIAMLDEELLESYMSSEMICDADIVRLVKKRAFFPCFFGSGLKLEGVEEFLEALGRYTEPPEYPEQFGASIFKIARDSRGKRLTYMKITGGEIAVRSGIRYFPRGASEPLDEKISEIRLYSGVKYDTAEKAEAGQIAAVLGLTGTYPGQGIGFESDAEKPLLEPVLGYRVELPKGIDARTVLPKLKQLEEEDPQLHVVWNERLAEIQIQLMGAVQTDVIRELIRERFNIECSIGTGRILYRETLAPSTRIEGVGHYEPLRHYAEVHLILEPLERGCGIELDTAVPSDVLDINWQRLILTHLAEKIHIGTLAGFPIADMKITLAAGRAHLKHTEGGDFRQATYRAVRQGLMKARSEGKCVLLEPVFSYTLDVPTECIGRAITDIHAMGGEHSSPETRPGGRSEIHGTAPVSEMADYLTEVMAYTGGRGRLSCMSGGYRECRPEKAREIVEMSGYNPESDLENTPDSVFCAHGAGFNVRWDSVGEYMHIESVLRNPRSNGEKSGRTDSGRSDAGIQPASIDDKELEAIMDREFGPIRRKQYTSATVNAAPSVITISERKQRLIVDGYNLLFAWDEMKKLAEDNIDLARERLIDVMVNYSGYRNIETVLVFDAYKVPGGVGERYDESGLHVAYTRENESADLYIERLADEIGKNENVRVVTSDSLIRLTALRAGVLRTSSSEFISEIKEALAQMREELEKNR